jgi:hypothetical protein
MERYKMTMTKRTYTPIASTAAKCHLQGLLDSINRPAEYRTHMTVLGELLASYTVTLLPHQSNKETLIISTAEDADFLQRGVAKILHDQNIPTKLAVFWNHHYQLPNRTSVAPIVHKFIQSGYETATNIIIVKSVMSGSCVVRTNLIEMIDDMPNVENIFILAPVAHRYSEEKLKSEFPATISNKFKFICFAIDEQRSEGGEVIPGIGGQVYELLGLTDQPVLTAYMPQVVEQLAFADI